MDENKKVGELFNEILGDDIHSILSFYFVLMILYS